MIKKQSKPNNKIKIHNQEPDINLLGLPSAYYEGQAYDIMLHAWLGKMTGWLSPASLTLAMYDWWSHLTISPAKKLDLAQKAWDSLSQFSLQVAGYSGLETACKPRAQDHRFQGKEWDEFPFSLYSHTFLIYEKWWNEATSNVRGVSRHHQHVVNFVTRQILDVFSPSNSPFTNPEVIATTIMKCGANFVAGFNNYVEDICLIKHKQPPAGAEKFKVGEMVATTPGKVIYRNHLIELIQYEPTTQEVYAEPILFIPAWIMKYYILDLSKNNSLVKYLVNQGHTVFMISWRNPTSEDRNLGLDDYLNSGIMSAIQAVSDIVPDKKIHAAGYCLGGTLLTIAAAAMELAGDERLMSMTIFAAQVDFKDPGELSLFIDQSQISYLEDIMWEKGYLDGTQMSWAFSMLRSNDLIWSRMIHDYLLGKRRPVNDLMAWDYDTTRLPFRMHSEYLHNLFLNNDLVQGHYRAGKRKIALTDIKVPIFAVGTIKDHVSPWRSVYKIQLYTNTDATFVLTSGGHNAGIVSEPGHLHRTYQINTRKKGDKYISPDLWQNKVPKLEGSWWSEWHQWLCRQSDVKTLPPQIGDPKKDYTVLGDAPGIYVLQK